VTAAAPSARKGTKNRVPLNCRIDASTASQLADWRKKRVSQGVLMDRLVAHAKRTNFNPAEDCL